MWHEWVWQSAHIFFNKHGNLYYRFQNIVGLWLKVILTETGDACLSVTRCRPPDGAGEAHNMMENALSILIVLFPYNSNKLGPGDLRQKAVYFPMLLADFMKFSIVFEL